MFGFDGRRNFELAQRVESTENRQEKNALNEMGSMPIEIEYT